MLGYYMFVTKREPILNSSQVKSIKYPLLYMKSIITEEIEFIRKMDTNTNYLSR